MIRYYSRNHFLIQLLLAAAIVPTAATSRLATSAGQATLWPCAVSRLPFGPRRTS